MNSLVSSKSVHRHLKLVHEMVLNHRTSEDCRKQLGRRKLKPCGKLCEALGITKGSAFSRRPLASLGVIHLTNIDLKAKHANLSYSSHHATKIMDGKST